MPRPIARDHGEKRDRILSQAARVFAKDGYDRASMAQVAKACGISKAAIYHYHASKEDLLFDILDTHLRGLRDRLDNLPEASQPRVRLSNIISEILTAYEGADDAHRLQMGSFEVLPTHRQIELKNLQKDIVQRMARTIADLSHRLMEDPSAQRRTAMAVFGMLNWYFMWGGPSAADRTAYAETVTTLTLDGLSGL
ncbi:TetR/AcrR family transcriptional regulator [Litoreibacter roseus]|uniref:TetR family transcriptional regulator n=1 Tax=Litoreibacter roseus TaxID=2601869 RepID=A0A6N6JG26_9RHOB|nr:TetR/AcrR family transcriptional regulator [Litoreibacter roseus]GFE64329.1 TetR family transcriptional regulator [Litoreibacter roseus]